MQNSGSDRREFFRINDTVVIEYAVVSKDDTEQQPNHSHQLNIDESSDKIQLRNIQNNLNHLFDSINQADREIARALRLLDDKINLLTQALYRQSHPITPEALVEANLSGGGIAFMVEEPVSEKETVEIYLQLLPSGTQINAIAKVISCDKIDGADPSIPYHLRLAFTHMDEQDRNLLVKHTLNRQAEALRSGRKDSVMSLREI